MNAVLLYVSPLVVGFLLDLILGDPHYSFHPVRLMGWLILGMEKGVRRVFKGTSGKEFIGGIIFFWLVVIISTLIPLGLLILAGSIHPYLRWGVASILCYQLLAARSLKVESMKVYKALEKGEVEEARGAVSMIVGRDTQLLSEEGIIKATVETVAENTSDGIIGPLFYMTIGGPVLGFLYKAVNTMDSMVGYKNETYLYFGRFAAWMDDLFNLIPARLSAFFMIIASYLLGYDGKNARKIYGRDRKKHASPNAGQTEAVMAGALDIQLAGDAFYFGKRVKKERIGDPLREVTKEDIKKSNRLAYGTAVLTLLLLVVIKTVILMVFW